MRRTFILVVTVLAMAAGAAAAPPLPYTPDQARALAVRVAQIDGYDHLAEKIMTAQEGGKAVGGLLIARDQQPAMRVMLRSAARVIGDPRVYSDGVAEVDVEIPLEIVLKELHRLLGLPEDQELTLSDLRRQVIDGYLRASGRGAPPLDMPPETVKKVAAARLGDFVEMFPVGWERVTAAGRVEAESRARVQAYAAMEALVRGIRLNQNWTIGALVSGSPAAEVRLDVFVRGLPLAGPVRLMPDRVAEAEVAASIRDLIKVLRDIRALKPVDPRWTLQQAEELSVQLKNDRLLETGRGMPPLTEIRPPEALAEAGAPLPDWAATVLEARSRARRPDDIENDDEARLLASRSAKSKAMADLEKQLDAVRLDDGRTVRERAAKDEVFRKDILALLASSRITESEPVLDGRQWEVTLKLPLVRLWEFSRLRP